MEEQILNRVKEIAKGKNIDLKDIATHFGISYVSLWKRLQGGVKVKTIQDIASFLECDIHELIPTGPDYAHFYDKQEWLGIRKK